MDSYFNDRVAVVTGGTSGIGLALCERLLVLGAKAVVYAGSTAERLRNAMEKLDGPHPGRALGVQADVRKKEDVENLIARAADFGEGRVDFLFNNAGRPLFKPFDETTDEDWRNAFDINFYGALHGVRAALPIMRRQGSGHIANTASGEVFWTLAHQSMYAATKAALLGFTSALRYEFWYENICFSTIIPGSVVTPIWGETKPPSSSISPETCARAVLDGVAAKEKVIYVTEEDRWGARDSYNPDISIMEGFEQILLDIARKRRAGQSGFD